MSDLWQGKEIAGKIKLIFKVSTTFNPFMYLSVPIPDYNRLQQKGGSVYLEECIEKFIEEEVMEGSDAW